MEIFAQSEIDKLEELVKRMPKLQDERRDAQQKFDEAKAALEKVDADIRTLRAILNPAASVSQPVTSEKSKQQSTEAKLKIARDVAKNSGKEGFTAADLTAGGMKSAYQFVKKTEFTKVFAESKEGKYILK